MGLIQAGRGMPQQIHKPLRSQAILSSSRGLPCRLHAGDLRPDIEREGAEVPGEGAGGECRERLPWAHPLDRPRRPDVDPEAAHLDQAQSA